MLVWQADTLTMNPTVSSHVIEDAYAGDAASASAEYGAEFRADIESFVTPEALEQCVIPNRLELPPMTYDYDYVGLVDPSGGNQDAFTLAIAIRGQV